MKAISIGTGREERSPGKFQYTRYPYTEVSNKLHHWRCNSFKKATGHYELFNRDPTPWAGCGLQTYITRYLIDHSIKRRRSNSKIICL